MKYSYNKHFFNKIDTEEKAYFLGLLYADGYNWRSGKSKYITLSLQDKDIDILEKFNTALNGNIKIRTRLSKNVNHSDQVSFQINGKEISNDLHNLGCIQNKSKSLKFPNLNSLSQELIPHFIRGYFDGDGSVWEGKRKKMLVKKNKTEFRERIIHNVKFTITGTEDIITNIQKILVNNSVINLTKLNRSKRIENCITLENSGRLQCKKFYNYLYNNANVYMNRKKEKFESIICANI